MPPWQRPPISLHQLDRTKAGEGPAAQVALLAAVSKGALDVLGRKAETLASGCAVQGRARPTMYARLENRGGRVQGRD